MSARAATAAAGKGIPGCALSVSGPSDFRIEWNADNQLKRVSLNGNEVARFAYDPNGRRVEKVAGGVTTSYLYDEEDVVRETRGAATFKYIHGAGTDEPLAKEESSGALTYYHPDGLGSIVRRTNQSGAPAHEYRYDAWGSIEAGATEPGYAFTGREWDPETRLYYYRARYYDGQIGRFISEDPMGATAGPNFYSYVANNPLRFVDPEGLLKLTNFPTAAEEEDVKRALDTLRQTLNNSCCAGKHTDQLLNKVNNPKLEIVFQETLPDGACGFTGGGAVLGLKIKINISRAAWHCCYQGPDENSLPSTIMHELVHVSFGRDKTAYALEETCFGCKEPPKSKGN
jgi:RHS repeat-associated protein